MKTVAYFFAVFSLITFACQTSAAPAVPAPKGKITKKVVLPKRLGQITGNITLYDTPRGGCTALHGTPIFFDNNVKVESRRIFLRRIPTGNPRTTGLSYVIKNLRAGSHRVSILMAGQKSCPKFGWRPRQHTVRLGPPKYKATRVNFVFLKIRKRGIEHEDIGSK